MKLRYATALAALLCTCVGSAQAGQLAFGTSNIQFNVIDLTPDDGAAAGFAVTNTYSTVAMSLNRPQGYRSIETDVLGLRDVIAAGTIYGTHASAGVSAVLGDTTITYSEPAPAYTFSVLKSRQEVTVTLKANSVLVVGGNTFAQLSGWNGAADFEGQIGLTLRAGATGGFDGPYNQLVRQIDYAAGVDTIAPFQLSYANVTNQDTTLRLEVSDYFYFNAPRPLVAVPEPASYALLGAGLLVVGAARRRNSVNNHVKAVNHA